VSELEVLQNVIHGSAAPLGPDIPVPLRMIVEKALEKDAGDRYQSMRDLVVDLRRVARRRPEDSGQVAAGAATAGRAPWARLGLAALAVVLAIVAGTAIGRRWNTPSPPAGPPPDVRFQRITDFVGIEEMPAVSPDGKTVAFVAPLEGRRQIWIRLLAGGAALPITPMIRPRAPALVARFERDRVLRSGDDGRGVRYALGAVGPRWRATTPGVVHDWRRCQS
jgi:hypothetical protein